VALVAGGEVAVVRDLVRQVGLRDVVALEVVRVPVPDPDAPCASTSAMAPA
jgi:hypothetical protein